MSIATLPAMLKHLLPTRRFSRVACMAAVAWSASSPALAQVPDQPPDPWRPAALARERDSARPSDGQPGAEPTPSPPPRPRFFRVPLDIGGEPPGRCTDDEGSPGPGRLQVQFGEDNPFLDIRRPGDPGGVGYQKLNTQLQVFDNGSTGLVVGVRALRPAGVEFDGVSEGPTVVSPALGLSQDLGDGTALQGFVGKDLRAVPELADSLERNLQYGMAVQTPLPGAARNPDQGVFLFVEALGRYRHDLDLTRNSPMAWEVLPGLHWRNADHWWMSGGVLVPVGTGRPDGGVLQFTCGVQF